MELLKKTLWFLRLTDEDGKISLTNIAVWITLGKLITTQNLVSPVDLGALLTSLAAYHGKKMLTNGKAE
jgi:hypothetical protein